MRQIVERLRLPLMKPMRNAAKPSSNSSTASACVGSGQVPAVSVLQKEPGHEDEVDEEESESSKNLGDDEDDQDWEMSKHDVREARLDHIIYEREKEIRRYRRRRPRFNLKKVNKEPVILNSIAVLNICAICRGLIAPEVTSSKRLRNSFKAFILTYKRNFKCGRRTDPENNGLDLCNMNLASFESYLMREPKTYKSFL